MIITRGKYNTAKIFTDSVDEDSLEQVANLLNQPFAQNQTIRFMPDIHAGAGCVIGTTMTVADEISPNLVGVDIGCGMLVAKISRVGNMDSDFFEKLQQTIEDNVPSGFYVNKDYEEYASFFKALTGIDNLIFTGYFEERALASIGTLGGGNHFIELARGERTDDVYLIIHSGSRHLGLQIAKHYQRIAEKEQKRGGVDFSTVIKTLKEEGREQEIEAVLNGLKSNKVQTSASIPCLTGENTKNYLHDMAIAQQYASTNRIVMMHRICQAMDFTIEDSFETVHNYIDFDTMILRKGAVSAQQGEILLIPMNMRDGSLLCVGKGNPDWNYSAPHGAGRIMSRTQAKKNISLESFISDMKGINTFSVSESTIDEAPSAYKPVSAIVDNIGDAVDIVEILRPVFNFKAQ